MSASAADLKIARINAAKEIIIALIGSGSVHGDNYCEEFKRIYGTIEASTKTDFNP